MSGAMKTPDDILGYLSMSYMDSLGVFIYHPIFSLCLFIALFLLIAAMATDVVEDTIRLHPGIALSALLCAAFVSTWVVIIFMWSSGSNYPSKEKLTAMLRDGVSININISDTSQDISVKNDSDFKKLSPEYVGGNNENIFSDKYSGFDGKSDKENKTFSIGDEFSNKELLNIFSVSTHWKIQSFICNKEADVGKRECFVFIKPIDDPKKIFRISFENLGVYGEPYHNKYLEQKGKARADYEMSRPMETVK